MRLEQLRQKNFLLYSSDAMRKTFLEQLFQNRGVTLNVKYRCPGTIGRQFSQMHNLYLLIGDTTSEIYPNPGTVLVPVEGPIQTISNKTFLFFHCLLDRGHFIPGAGCCSGGYACWAAASMSARYFFTLTSLTTQVKTFMARARSSSAGKEGAIRMLLSWGSLP